jgi:hypothetical protein
MAARIDNTPTATQARAPLQTPEGKNRRFESFTLQRAGWLEVIVFLVDTPVEQEKGFSLAESTTSPKLSRYTFDMFEKTKKEADRSRCLPDKQASSAPIDVTSRCNIDVTCQWELRELRSDRGFSRHACREKSPATPAGSTKGPKLLDTLLRYSEETREAYQSRY